MTKFNKPTVSCEFFPVTTEIGAQKLAQVRASLVAYSPEYFSVTYGAGGSTQDRTWALVKAIHEEQQVAVMPHLTCVAADKAEIVTLLDAYFALGVRRLMALRGDVPSGMYHAGELDSAIDLVELIRARWGDEAKISVAAYPEVHPRSLTPADDLRHFCDKMKAGADEAVTQYFFNADAYLRFRDEALALGVDKPIVPGIMPISNYQQLARFSDACGAELPRWLRRRLEAYGDDLEALQAFGHEVVVKLCERLLAEGVGKLHFYSMNKAEHLLAIFAELGLSPKA